MEYAIILKDYKHNLRIYPTIILIKTIIHFNEKYIFDKFYFYIYLIQKYEHVLYHIIKYFKSK